MATQAQLAAVQQLYVGYLGRAADSAGQAFWANAIAAGTATIKSVATGFTLSAEYSTAYAGLANDALVDKVYNNVLGRAADASGKAFWVAALASGTVTAATLVATIVTNLGALDQATINNKVFVAQTYTDTVGTSYTPAGGAAVITGVTNDPATVTTAISSITSGSVSGQVVGLNLINAVTAAATADTAYQAANKAAVDALVIKTPGAVASADFHTELASVKTNSDINSTAAHTHVVGSTPTLFATGILGAQVTIDQTAVTTAYNALDANGKTLATSYQSAIVTNAGLTAAAATDVASVKAGLAADTNFGAALALVTTAHGTVTDVASLYAYYTAASTTDRATIDTDFANVTTYTAFKTTATVDVNKNTAFANEASTKAAVITEAGNSNYTTAVTTLKTDTGYYTTAQTADASKAVVDALVVASAASTQVVTDAGLAIGAFNSAPAHIGVVQILDESGNISTGAVTATAAKETFYFAPNTVAQADFSIGTSTATTQFGTGDAIVLGAGYTYNAGALTTGNNNALEFFLVKTDTGTQVVIETKAYASGAGVTVDAHTGVGVSTSDNLTVINLVGVTAAHVAVANGVVSYV
ncbi:DUF4214 domain-containing protein [Pseudomonas sp. CCI1.2]|uniref:DUF4214 domain-containing protein n=1 Tax=Pseudomonas sp. CCI1.2 TaxID=3048614 RepID=UPI002B2319EB|nr:DUF4214 domain-containing protein [Pseudomonas sp. CCI1.2]MEB0120496.1 DUF4214 domain-containing protein [Pseudomonas sp. CCI1.2]